MATVLAPEHVRERTPQLQCGLGSDWLFVGDSPDTVGAEKLTRRAHQRYSVVRDRGAAGFFQARTSQPASRRANRLAAAPRASPASILSHQHKRFHSGRALAI